MGKFKEVLLALAIFNFLNPVMPFSKGKLEGNELEKIISKENISKEGWFEKGDMYEYRSKKVPLKVIICEDNLFSPELNDYDSIQIVRDDYIFKARLFTKAKNGLQEWFPSYKVDKNYLERLNEDYIRNWLKKTNYWLDYLSGNKFQLELEGIERVKTDYWNGKFWEKINLGNVYNLIIHPNATRLGYYSENGIIFINPLYVYYGKDSTEYSCVFIHEILHSLLGPRHSRDSPSSIYHSSTWIGLTEKEAGFLGWPKVKSIKLKDIVF